MGAHGLPAILFSCIYVTYSTQAAFDERVKIFSTWESAQSTLAKKREAKNKATAQGKAERVAQCEEDIKFVSFSFFVIIVLLFSAWQGAHCHSNAI